MTTKNKNGSQRPFRVSHGSHWHSEARQLFANGVSKKQIAANFGRSEACVQLVCKGLRSKTNHISISAIKRCERNSTTPRQSEHIKAIKELWSKGLNTFQISKNIRVDESVVANLLPRCLEEMRSI